MHWDPIVRVFEFLLGSGVLGFLWKTLRKLDRLIVVFEEYPPHRHVGNSIIYPRGREPGVRTEMTDEAAASKGRV